MNTDPILLKRTHTEPNNNVLIVKKRQKPVVADQKDSIRYSYEQHNGTIHQAMGKGEVYRSREDTNSTQFFDVHSSKQKNIVANLPKALPCWGGHALAQKSSLYLPNPKIVAREVQEAFVLLQQKFKVGQTEQALEPSFIAIISDYSGTQLQYINFFLNDDSALRALQTLEHIFGRAFAPNLVWISYIIRSADNIINVFQKLCGQLFCRNEADNTWRQDAEGYYFFKEEIKLLFQRVPLPEIATLCYSGAGWLNIQIINTLCKFYVKVQLIENDLDKSSREKSEEMQESWAELTHSLRYGQYIKIKKVEQVIESLKARYLSMFPSYHHENSEQVTPQNVDRLLAEFASSKEFGGDTKPRSAAYGGACEDLSLDSLLPLPVEVEFPKKSNIIKVPTLNDKTQTAGIESGESASLTMVVSDIVNSGEVKARSDGAKPIYNRRAGSNDVTNFSSIDYNYQDSSPAPYALPEISQPKINKHIFAVLQKRFKFEQGRQQLKDDFITVLSPQEKVQNSYMKFFIQNTAALRALKTLEYKFEADFNENLVSISSIIRQGTYTGTIFADLCEYLFDLNAVGHYQEDHNGHYIFKEESNFLLKYISFHEIATICWPGAGRTNLQLVKKLGKFYAAAQSEEQDLSKRVIMEVSNIRAGLEELQPILIDMLPATRMHAKIHALINQLTIKYDAIIHGDSDNNIILADSNLSAIRAPESLVMPEIIASNAILLASEASALIGDIAH